MSEMGFSAGKTISCHSTIVVCRILYEMTCHADASIKARNQILRHVQNVNCGGIIDEALLTTYVTFQLMNIL